MQLNVFFSYDKESLKDFFVHILHGGRHVSSAEHDQGIATRLIEI